MFYSSVTGIFCVSGDQSGGNMKIFRKAMYHIMEMHPNANLVKAEFRDQIFTATILDDIGHINIKAHIVDGFLVLEESEVKV